VQSRVGMETWSNFDIFFQQCLFILQLLDRHDYMKINVLENSLKATPCSHILLYELVNNFSSTLSYMELLLFIF